MIELGSPKADYMTVNHSTEKIHLDDELFWASKLYVFFLIK